jgi:predicted phage terminase large subunit-like protein
VNRSIPRADLERFNAALAEKRRRIAKAEHQTRGYRDEDGVWQGGLLSFVRYFWHVLEPGTLFVDGWVLEAICEHLEAVTYGEITNLLINVFPGAMKSLLTNVFWPAWEWGAMDLAHLRYVTFSYSSSNTERDNQRFGDLVSSPDYQAMYPHVVIRQNGMTMVSNRKHGWKLASSVTGSVTGKRGNRAICFPSDQLIDTAIGPIAIGKFVKNRMDLLVWSYNRSTEKLELKPVIGWHTNPGRHLVRVGLEDGSSVTCTLDHLILGDEGYRFASDIRIGHRLIAAPSRVEIAAPAISGEQVQVQMLPDPPISDAGDGATAYPKFSAKIRSSLVMASRNLANHVLGKMRCAVPKCSVSFAVGNVLSPRSIFDIAETGIASITIFMANFFAFGTRPQECCGHQNVAHPIESLAIAAKRDARVSFADRASHYLSRVNHLMFAFFMANPVVMDSQVSAPHHDARHTTNSAKVGNLVNPFKPDYWEPSFVRVVSVDLLHEIPSETFCITVEGNHNMLCGDGANIICSNCDDLNNVKESESKAVMDETNRWFRESLSSRLNSMETDAKIVISQRVSEADVSGEILRLQLPYCHLCIPMEYVWQADDNGEPYSTSIGWVDPRWRPNQEDCEGELAWTDRFSENSVRSLKVELGPYATASQLQQTPEARGGGLIKREWWMPAEIYMTGRKFPPFEYIVASLDGAYTEEEKNDPSALTIWGVFQNEHGYNRAMLVHAWSKRLEFSGPKIDILPNEHESTYKLRARPFWGLIEWVADSCNRFKADKLLIESKASGISAAQSLRNAHGRQGWTIQLVEPKGDKMARGMAIVPSFSQEMIYAPDPEEFDYAGKVIDECALFPYGTHDDLFDSMTQAIKHLRDTGLIRSDEERRAQELDAVRHRGAPKAPRYPGFGRRSA